MWYTEKLAQYNKQPQYGQLATGINDTLRPGVGPLENQDTQQPAMSPLEAAQKQQTNSEYRLNTPLNDQLGRARNLKTPIGVPEEDDSQSMAQQLNGDPPTIRSNGALGKTGQLGFLDSSLPSSVEWSR